MNPAELEILSDVRWRLAGAGHGAKDRIVQDACLHLQCSHQTLYRKLRAVGFESGRKQRKDAGERTLSTEQIRLLSRVLMASYNRKGQRMPIETVLEMVAQSVRANGDEWPDVSPSTASRQLYEWKLHPEQLSMPEQSVQLTSLHPNHVWQVDSTTGAYYYLPAGRLRWMDEAEFNKNKVANLVKASTDLLTRYCAADHTSHAMKVRYYLGGESARNLLDFMVWAIWRQESSPMCGVPLILMTDQGPANKSLAFALFCRRLSIEHIMHAPGRARVTGSVEKAHDLARMHLETRYHFSDAADVTLEKLNADAEAWAAAYCSSRVHTRHHRTRFGGWMEISRYPGALRMPASLEVLREAATSEPVSVRVRNDKRIAFKGQVYNLELVPGVIAGLQVLVAVNVYRHPAIDVQSADGGEAAWHVVEPEVANEWGFDGRRVIGEGFESPRKDALDHARDSGLREAYRTGDGLPTLEEAKALRKANARAFAQTIDPMADVKAVTVPTYLPRRAELLELPGRRVEARRISVVEACRAIKSRIGDAYTAAVFEGVSASFPDGVPEDAIDALCKRFGPVALDDSAAVGLRAIGGGAA